MNTTMNTTPEYETSPTLRNVLPGVDVRQAQSSDLAAVEQLLRDNRLPTDGVGDALENFIVAEARGSLVGAIGVELFDHVGLLRSAVVCSSARGSGIGALLVERVMVVAGAERYANSTCSLQRQRTTSRVSGSCSPHGMLYPRISEAPSSSVVRAPQVQP